VFGKGGLGWVGWGWSLRGLVGVRGLVLGVGRWLEQANRDSLVVLFSVRQRLTENCIQPRSSHPQRGKHSELHTFIGSQSFSRSEKNS